MSLMILRHCSSPILHVPAYNFKTRHSVLKIYEAFTLNHNLTLDKLPNPTLFISAVLSGVEEEKDPRNLLISYDLLYFILRQYSPSPNRSQDLIMPFVDEIFDKVSCYFPINFEPPKNDKY